MNFIKNFKHKYTFLLDSFERSRENLSFNVLLVGILSVVRELSPEKTVYRFLRSEKGWYRHILLETYYARQKVIDFIEILSTHINLGKIIWNRVVLYYSCKIFIKIISRIFRNLRRSVSTSNKLRLTVFVFPNIYYVVNCIEFLNILYTMLSTLMISLSNSSLWSLFDPWYPWRSGVDQTAEHIISGRCAFFRMPGANADLASPLPALCAWLEENDLAV